MLTLLQAKRLLCHGDWVLLPKGEITEGSKFQRQRLTEAVLLARIYLEDGRDTRTMGRAMGRTQERAAQMVRLGLKALQELGWLRPVDTSKPAGVQSRRPERGTGRPKGSRGPPQA